MDTVLENNQHTLPNPPEQLRSVHTITDRFSQTNSYLIEDSENGRIIIVDPGDELHVHLTLYYLQHILHRSPADIDLLVLTSLPSEYLPGLIAFHIACPGARVATSEAARPSLEEQETRELSMLSGEKHVGGYAFSGGASRLALSSAQYREQVRMIDTWLKDVAGLPAHPSWRVIAYPAHTPESMCLYNPFSKELLCGDILRTLLENRFQRRIGNYRYSNQQSQAVLQSLDVCYLYPLHGRPVLSTNPFKHIAEHWSDE